MSNAPTDLAALACTASAMLVASQTATLQVLGVEMQGLVQMIPGAVAATTEPQPTEEEIEQGFENMPV